MNNSVLEKKIFVVFALFCLLGIAGPTWATSANDGFNPDANGPVYAIALQADGKIVVGGQFTQIGGQTRNRIARLNGDGSLDAGFNPGANGLVNSIALQTDGKIVVGGQFTQIGGQTRNYIARLNGDGSLDTGFNPGADYMVSSIAVQADGKILVGGYFTTIGGQARDHIARLNVDGSVDAGFNPGASSYIYSIALQADGKIVLGGHFSTIGGQARNYIARLHVDGSVDTSFNPDANGIVESIAIQSDCKIVVGGYFTQIGGQARNHIARLNVDGSLDAGFNAVVVGWVYSIAIQADGKILLGGEFTFTDEISYYITRRNRDGSIDAGFLPWADNTVRSIALQADGKILVGGNFTQIISETRHHIARFHADAKLDTDFNPGANGLVNSIALQTDGKIVVGGTFTTVGGQARDRIARLNVDGSLDAGFNPGASSYVYSIALQADGKIVVGGRFTQIGGQARDRIARMNGDGSLDAGFNPGASSYVYSIALQADGKIVVGGNFTTIGGQARNYIARLNVDGSLDTGFNPDANSSVYSIAIQTDGKIVVGGWFTNIGGQARNYIARLNSDGSIDAGFNPGANDGVRSIAIQADGKILVGGNFTTIGGQARDRIARLNSDGSVDAGFNPGASSYIYSIALQADGKILVGGNFTTIGGQARDRIARLNGDGSLDAGFNPGANDWVYSIVLQSDGKIVVGGQFTQIDGQAKNFIARLSADEAALQNLAVAADGTSITWFRGQSSPEIHDVTFEHSDDSLIWTSLGAGTRISGGWHLGGQSLPHGVNRYVRGRGQVLGGYFNASTSQLESVRLYYLPATITVTSPNGSESWMVGESFDITWTSTGTIANVQIEYSANNGGSWINIVASTANDGSYPWTIPDMPSSTCLVRVRDAVDSDPSDSSDAVFTILAYVAPTITVLSPNGGENWSVGSSQNITWSSTGTVGNVNIDYSINNGSNWIPVAVSTENDGSYSWTIPAAPSTTCLVRVRDAIDNDPSDSSDAVFTIADAETVSTPTTPTGPSTGLISTSYDFSTGGSTSSLGHDVQYFFDWDDGTDSGWLAVGTTEASHSWAAAGTYDVRAMARCATHTTIESLWSDDLAITISDGSSAGYYNSPAQYKVLPEVIWASATGGGTWMSNVQVTDVSGGSQVASITTPLSGRRGPFLLWDNTAGAALSSLKYANLLETIDGLDSGTFSYSGTVGAVEFVTQDGSHLLQAAARTLNGNYCQDVHGGVAARCQHGRYQPWDGHSQPEQQQHLPVELRIFQPDSKRGDGGVVSARCRQRPGREQGQQIPERLRFSRLQPLHPGRSALSWDLV